MALPQLLPKPPYAKVATVGIPRALLYFRSGVFWTSFFEALGRTVLISEPTTQALLNRGEALSVDECCLASKIYLGHVESLLPCVDALFVPAMVAYGAHEGFCTKFQSLPDLVINTFAEQNPCVLSLFVDESGKKSVEREAYISLAQQMGASKKQAQAAWKTAFAAQKQHDRALVQTFERRLAQQDNAPKILIVAHPYVAYDHFMGGGIAQLLDSLGVCALNACEANREQALAQSQKFSKTMPWLINRELVGALMLAHEQVDGIILVSAFPCGPDSMTNDAVTRVIQGKPILTLTVDGQSGSAGLETRVESFVDILRYQQKGGYLQEAHEMREVQGSQEPREAQSLQEPEDSHNLQNLDNTAPAAQQEERHA